MNKGYFQLAFLQKNLLKSMGLLLQFSLTIKAINDKV